MMHELSGARLPALWANAKQLCRVRYARVPHLSRQLFQGVGDAEIDRLHFRADAADNVVVMIFLALEFVATCSIAEITTSHQTQFFERGEIPVHGDKITGLFFQALVNLFDRERPVRRRKDRQNISSRPGNAMLSPAQRGQRLFQSYG